MVFKKRLDKRSISLSVACAVLLCAAHCLALPMITVIGSAVLGTVFSNEVFHQWLAFVVLPSSLILLFVGFKQHKSGVALALGVYGLLILVFTALFGHRVFGETGENIAMVAGVCFIALAHYQKYIRCQQTPNDCTSC